MKISRVSAQAERRWHLPFIALALGLASAFAFQPVGWWPLMPLAFAGLAEVLRRTPGLWRALLTGWLFGVGQFVIGLNWIATAFTFQAAMPAWYGWIAVVLLSFYLAVYPALAAGLGWRFGQRSPVALVLALAGAWALTEWLRATMFTGFAWNPVGVTLVDTPLRGAAALVGTYGLSAITIGIGGSVWLLLHRRRIAIASLGAWAAILVLASIPTVHVGPSPSGGYPVRIIQPNIGQEQKWRPGLDQEAFARLGRLSWGGGGAPRLLLWPEVAVPVPFQAIEPGTKSPPVTLPAAAQAAAYLRPGDILVTGAVGLVANPRGEVVGETNSVMPITAGGQILGRYDKAHLVPYGEYLPMRPLLSSIGLSQLAPGIGDTQPGPGPRTLTVPGFGKMAVQVCYEIIFSGQVVDRHDRPDFIFNPSNDAWFGRWGPPQHLAQARLRATEEGLPVIRSTPTGISALVDAHGNLIASLPWRTAGKIDATMPWRMGETTFAHFGNAIPLTLAFLLLIIAIGIDGSRRYRRGI